MTKVGKVITYAYVINSEWLNTLPKRQLYTEVVFTCSVIRRQQMVR